MLSWTFLWDPNHWHAQLPGNREVTWLGRDRHLTIPIVVYTSKTHKRVQRVTTLNSNHSDFTSSIQGAQYFMKQFQNIGTFLHLSQSRANSQADNQECQRAPAFLQIQLISNSHHWGASFHMLIVALIEKLIILEFLFESKSWLFGSAELAPPPNHTHSRARDFLYKAATPSHGLPLKSPLLIGPRPPAKHVPTNESGRQRKGRRAWSAGSADGGGGNPGELRGRDGGRGGLSQPQSAGEEGFFVVLDSS